MQVIPFNQLPENIQAIFRSERANCTCYVKDGLKEGTERYYVRFCGEMSVFAYKNGTWEHLKSYGVSY